MASLSNRRRAALILLSAALTTSTLAQAQFETRASVAAPSGAQSFAVGDFNNDGKLDIADPNYFNSTQISVFLGNGDGTFQAPVLYGAGNEPDTVVAADLNHDGNLDLVVGNFLSGNVSVLLGNGDGTFRSAENYDLPTSGSATFVGVGDFNGDGNPDLAAIESNSSCQCIVLFLGNGDGTFQTPPITYSSVFNLSAFAIGDFNSDGKLDLAVTEYGLTGNQLEILLGNGDGSFQSGGTYLSGQGPFDVQAAYLNNQDHNLDLVVTIGGGLSVLLGNGDGTFRGPTTYTPATNRVTVADFNGDGNLDLAATGTAQTGQLIVFLGNGDGTFQPAKTYKTGQGSGFVIAEDFNGDHQTDVAIVDGSATFYVTVILNTGAVSFSQVTPISFPIQLVGTTSSARSVTMTNVGNASLSISSITSTGEFKASSTCGSSLAPGANCKFTATFSPTGQGMKTGTISIVDSASTKPQVVELTGTGTVAKFVPSSLTFGAQKVGTTSAPQQVQLTNVGSKKLTISQILIGGSEYRDFLQTNTCGTGIGAGASCTITVTFKPTKTGKRTAIIYVTDTGGGSPQSVPLTGTGD